MFRLRRSQTTVLLVVVMAACVGGCSDPGNDVTFAVSGGSCTHDGQSDIKRRPNVGIINESDREVGIKLWVVPAGTTAADVEDGDYDGIQPTGIAFADPFDQSGSGLGVSLERGNRIMIECFYADVPSIEGTLSRAFFDVPLD